MKKRKIFMTAVLMTLVLTFMLSGCGKVSGSGPKTGIIGAMDEKVDIYGCECN